MTDRTKHTLQENSEIYYDRAAVYDAFSAAEDADGKVFDFLLPYLKGRSVLDLGCGTGKYLRLLAPHVRAITGLDAAQAQLAIARRNTANSGNVTLVHGDALTAPLPLARYDAVIACWMLGTVVDETRRRAILDRARSILSPGGIIFLVENNSSGAFEEMRGKIPASTAYNKWLTDVAGFTPSVRLPARFLFDDTAQARSIIGAIWGAPVAARVEGPDIAHNIVIFTKNA